ncbi:MAG: efflux RND transporter permease subunit [Anaerolineae bacterium]|nr:efflux RND transporter permease subunit [Anaerolineae bacterium]
MTQGHDLDALAGEVRARAEDIFGPENVTVSAATISETGFGGLNLVLSGDPDLLREIDPDVAAALRGIEGVANISSSLELASQAGESAILRIDGESAVQYTAEFETADTLGVTAIAKDTVVAMLADKGLTDEVQVSEGFVTEVQTSGFSQIITSMGLAIIVVYFVMVFTFRSFLHPFTILFSLPLAVVGAAIALWLTDRVLGLSAMVGLLMLVGIVVTNAIVLIDRVQQNRKEHGMDAHTALVEGAQTRLRPILMTALAAIFALIPLAAQLMGPGGAIVAAELGTVVIGGLTTSTFLTLLVVPIVYSLLDDFSARFRGGRPARNADKAA